MKDKVYSMPLIIPPDKTIAETKKMLDVLFSSNVIISINEPFEFEDDGMTFVIDYYAEDEKQVLHILKEAGIIIHQSRLFEMAVE